MDSIYVQGGVSLCGKVRIQGSKNAALPILAASLLTTEKIALCGCPRISDVFGMVRILESLGCKAKWDKDALTIQADEITGNDMPEDDVGSMRSSIFLLGALLGRKGEARLAAPGGCVIGKRPIDIHLKALGELGVTFSEEGGILCAKAGEGLQGSEVTLGFPSVGATENVIMAAVKAKGTTVLRGAAKEPEVQSLCEFLNALGGDVRGIGESTLIIKGVRELKGGSFQIPADRIVAGTYLLAGFSTGGEIFLENAPVEQMISVLEVAKKMGARYVMAEDGIYVRYPRRPGKLPFLETDVYPGFPTDLQSVLLAVRCTGEGRTVLRENIFENRFRVLDELEKLGAKIKRLDERSVLIQGVERLRGTEVDSLELRGGAALVAAALGASGETMIHGRRFMERGYENIVRDFRDLGARIVSG